MSSALAFVNGLPRMGIVVTTLPNIYEAEVSIVASGGNGTTTLNAPIVAGTPVTLPNSGTYTVVSGVTNLHVELNGIDLTYLLDFSTSGTTPFTSVSFTFALAALDVIKFRTERNT